jgi:dTDP-4-dehydrorhamnose reductase
MRVLITGANGLLAQKLVELLYRCGTYEVLLTSRQELSVFNEETFKHRTLDIISKREVRSVIDEFEPEVIINAAAMTNVDLCETERAQAWQSNAAGVENLVYASKLVGAKFIQISTDYVFDGKNGPYDEYEKPNPINYYGKTKLAAENIVRSSGVPYAIVRTLFLYGAGVLSRANVALRILESLVEGQQYKVADDQFSNPTLVDDVAFGVLKILEMNCTGIFHIAGPKLMSKAEFALKVAKSFDFDKKLIVPVKTAALKQAAVRPLRSGFITLKAETTLGLKTTSIEQGLLVLKSQIQHFRETEEES